MTPALARAHRATLPITEAGVVRVLPPVRERYLDPQVDHAIVQAAGPTLNAWLRSRRGDVCLQFPLTEYRFERAYDRAIHRWGINVNRWLDWLAVQTADDGTRQLPTAVAHPEAIADA